MLEAPLASRVPRTAQRIAPKTAGPRRVPGAPSLRRDMSEDFAGGRVLAVGDSEDEIPGYVRSRRFSGLRFRLRGGVPKSIVGRVMGSVVLLGALGAFTAVLWEARAMLLHDPRLVIASSSSIQITGNNHLTRPQLLSVFGEDVDRNLLTVSLSERRQELESLPWVEHATVMRLLPNKVRVTIVERTPVAFVRQGKEIGLVDAKGVLLDLSPDVQSDNHYSFPVVTGITAQEPASTREARMKLFMRFTSDLDAGSGSEPISKKLSEVDLSSPEDVKALIPSGTSDVLVHFGDDDFLKRYKSYESNLPGWKAAYPKLASVDMRYEHNVVLEMAPGSAVPLASKAADVPIPIIATKIAKAPAKAVPTKRNASSKVAVKLSKPAANKAPAVTKAAPKAAPKHLQVAHDVHAKARAAAAGSRSTRTAQAGHQ